MNNVYKLRKSLLKTDKPRAYYRKLSVPIPPPLPSHRLSSLSFLLFSPCRTKCVIFPYHIKYATFSFPANQPFLTKVNKELVCDYKAMVANVRSGGKMFPVVDARGRARFHGNQKEPRPGLVSGHIPYSANLPFVECFEEDGKTMKDPEHLKKVFADNGVDLSRPFTTTCGSGITACIVAFAADQCGRGDVCVYDGSWSEWRRQAPPEMIAKQ